MGIHRIYRISVHLHCAAVRGISSYSLKNLNTSQASRLFSPSFSLACYPLSLDYPQALRSTLFWHSACPDRGVVIYIRTSEGLSYILNYSACPQSFQLSLFPQSCLLLHLIFSVRNTCLISIYRQTVYIILFLQL